MNETIVILNGFGRFEVKKFKYVAASILVALCCVIVIGVPKVALAAGDNQLTVNVTDDYYRKPVDGVTITVTDTATGSVVAEQVTDAMVKFRSVFQMELIRFSRQSSKLDSK